LKFYDYTDREVVSIPKFKALIQAEYADKIVIGDQSTKSGKISIWKGGYQQRYGDAAEEECMKVISRKYCCVTNLIDYMVSEAKKLYAGTDMGERFMIYHDHLKVMWEKNAIAYMREKDYFKYFIKISGVYNDRVSNIYKNCLVGNRPEMARALDSYGFADLMVSIRFHVALTFRLDRENPMKFQLGTPREAFKCMKRCWEVEPTLERVVQDIESWEYAVNKIIEARGTIVHGLALRHGHRWARANGKGESTSRRLGRQRKDTFCSRPVHPDALSSLNRLICLEEQTRMLRVVLDAEEAAQAELLLQHNDLDFDSNNDN
jgi:hypothetical protein